MQITDVKVRKLFEDGPMKAIVSVTFDGQLAVHDIKVINARDKFFIVMPSRKNPDETFRDIVHPINSQFRGVLEKAVIEAYNQALADAAAEAATADAESLQGPKPSCGTSCPHLRAEGGAAAAGGSPAPAFRHGAFRSRSLLWESYA